MKQEVTKQQVLIIHGGNTFTTYDNFLSFLKSKVLSLDDFTKVGWKDTLQEKLGELYQVITPTMPNKHNAKYEEWKIYFEKIFTLCDDDVILIGHSLGGIFLMKYLSETKVNKKIKKLILIAPPCKDSQEEQLSSFALDTTHIKDVLNTVKDISLYQSKDDYVVSYDNAEEYKKILPEITLKTFTDRGHFTGEEIKELNEEIMNL